MVAGMSAAGNVNATHDDSESERAQARPAFAGQWQAAESANARAGRVCQRDERDEQRHRAWDRVRRSSAAETSLTSRLRPETPVEESRGPPFSTESSRAALGRGRSHPRPHTPAARPSRRRSRSRSAHSVVSASQPAAKPQVRDDRSAADDQARRARRPARRASAPRSAGTQVRGRCATHVR